MSFNLNLARWVFKMRGGLWTLLFLMILFMTRHTDPEIILLSLVIILAGQLWRCWAAGTITLYRGETVKAEVLATSGPYALMRNPLYFGNFLIGLGWSIISGQTALILFLTSFIILYVLIIIPYEENFLLSKFGHDYEKYCERVGMFFPKKFPVENLIGKFDVDILSRSEVHTMLTTLTGTSIIVAWALCYT